MTHENMTITWFINGLTAKSPAMPLRIDRN
jgi:hypothetical protein